MKKLVFLGHAGLFHITRLLSSIYRNARLKIDIVYLCLNNYDWRMFYRVDFAALSSCRTWYI